MIEIWKPIPSLEGKYEASSFGRIRSVERMVRIGSGVRKVKACVLKLFKKTTGYLACRADGQKLVHRLVALTWCEGYFKGALVDHLNGQRDDNRPENLEWVTASENCTRPFKNGTRVNPFQGVMSSDHPTSKSVVATSLATGKTRTFNCAMDAVREGFDSSSISRCCHGLSAHHKGHRWAFCDMNGVELTETKKHGFLEDRFGRAA